MSAEQGQELGDVEVSLLDLLDELEAATESDEIVRLIRVLGARAGAFEEDRDTLGSFGGIGSMCEKVQAAEFKGAVWTAFLANLGAFCSKSPFNRASLKDFGITDACVTQLIRVSHTYTPELANEAQALCAGIRALCLADDANKRCVARIRQDLNEEEITSNARNQNGMLVDDGQVPLFTSSEGGMPALLLLLEQPGLEPRVHLAAFRALRAVASDDDTRQSTCAPAAVENREFLTNTEGENGGRWRRTRNAISAAMENPSRQLAEAVLGIVKEVCWAQDKIFQLVYEDGLLPKILALTKREEYAESLSRMVLVVLRQFCFSDEMKTLCAMETDSLAWTVSMIKKHTPNEKLCEQAFGLFANMTIRMPDIAVLLSGDQYDVLSMAHTILHVHPKAPALIRTVVQTIRNLSKVPEVLTNIKESVLLDELRELVAEHRENPKWRDAVEISKQFLRELRCDDGLRNAPEWNEYY